MGKLAGMVVGPSAVIPFVAIELNCSDEKPAPESISLHSVPVLLVPFAALAASSLLPSPSEAGAVAAHPGILYQTSSPSLHPEYSAAASPGRRTGE